MSRPEDIDRIVEWCSVCGAGSRKQFDDACQNILGPNEKSWRILANLELMGHVEVDWPGGDGWSANPPALAHVAGSGGNAVLIGGRTTGTWTALEELFEQGVAASVKQIQNERDFPSSWFVGIHSTEVLTDIADQLGIVATTSLAYDYDNHFLGLDDILSVSIREYAGSGFQAERLDPITLRYQSADIRRGRWPPGLFRQLSAGRKQYIFIDDTEILHLLDRWTATHAELRRQESAGGHVPDVILYDFNLERMAVHVEARLPTQWARAALSGTGLPPHRHRHNGRSFDVYEGVSPYLYNRIWKSLGREGIPRQHDLSQFDRGATG